MKKNILLTSLLVILAIGTTFSQGLIEVTVKNIKEPKGNIRVGLYNTEKNFLEKPLDGKVVKASNKEVTIVFENLKAGNYAVSVIHDENENNELDSNFMGVPKEGYGFSNNAMGMFGPPSFDDAVIVVATKKSVSITLTYH
jgi:uncharacterized protein (DUF2141 family)